MLSCVTGLALSVSPCFAQENQNDPQEMRRQQEVRRAAEADARRIQAEAEARGEVIQRQLPSLKCDSLVPEVCVEIYRRLYRPHMNLMKQTPTDNERQR
jgi:hypothetical protein